MRRPRTRKVIHNTWTNIRNSSFKIRLMFLRRNIKTILGENSSFRRRSWDCFYTIRTQSCTQNGQMGIVDQERRPGAEKLSRCACRVSQLEAEHSSTVSCSVCHSNESPLNSTKEGIIQCPIAKSHDTRQARRECRALATLD
jgi:hypothetical protein